jgi:hypothetical protein
VPHYWTAARYSFQPPFTSFGTNDCIAYINKLAYVSSNYCSNQLVISASAGGYGDTNWYFDYTAPTMGTPAPEQTNDAKYGVLSFDSGASIIYSNTAGPASGTAAGHITYGVDVSAFYSRGVHGYFGDTNAGYAINGTIQLSSQSGWYLMQTDESYNGQRYAYIDGRGQGNVLTWFSEGAFGGTSHSKTPVGAVSNVNEPGTTSADPYHYYGFWASGRVFAYCAWNSPNSFGSLCIQAVGDPFTKQ